MTLPNKPERRPSRGLGEASARASGKASARASGEGAGTGLGLAAGSARQIPCNNRAVLVCVAVSWKVCKDSNM